MNQVLTATEEFQDMNCLIAEVGTNCPRGGDSGSGGRTVIRLRDAGGTDLRVGIEGATPESVTSVEIVVGGDAECRTLIRALQFALRTLRSQERVNRCSTGSISFD